MSAYRTLAALPLIVATVLVFGLEGRAAAQGEAIRIESQNLVFNQQDPQALRLGHLIWRAGLVLSSRAPKFGGWSDLVMSADGRTLTSVSDQGAWLTATVEYDADDNLVGLKNGRLGSLRDPDGEVLSGRGWTDAEGLARLPDGSWLVAFERYHRLRRYPTLDAAAERIDGPAEISRLPPNGGIKALTAMADGRLVAISEEYGPQPDRVLGWVGVPAEPGHYTWQSFEYPVHGEFRVSAMAALPDGSFIVLEHGFHPVTGARSRLMLIAGEQLKPPGLVQPKELATLQPPYVVDNFEGVAATRGARGETLIWLLSDDDLNPLQRNLLLQFELAPG